MTHAAALMPSEHSQNLLLDGSLKLAWTESLASFAHMWMPRSLPEPRPHASPAVIELRVGAPSLDVPEGSERLFRFWGLEAFDVGGSHIALPGTEGICGEIDLDGLRSVIHVDTGRTLDRQSELECHHALTISAALLLGRLGRAMVHGGAVLPPEAESAFLLMGDSKCGKSTTCASLVTAGWDYIADDQVILGQGPGGVDIESWLRPFQLDTGWTLGKGPSGQRARIGLHALQGGAHRRAARLGAILLPRVDPGLPTAISRVHATEALAGLMRQSPWLLADRVIADSYWKFLARAAAVPAYELRLGLDTFRDGERLAEVLSGAPLSGKG